MKDVDLICLAEQARQNAYAPYSGYTVGAALLCADGTVSVGCNVENASYGATICAERSALTRAVADGKRDFAAIAIIGGKAGRAPETFFSPCGICRQVLREFCRDDFRVLIGNGNEVVCQTLGELLPNSFSSDAMRGIKP